MSIAKKNRGFSMEERGGRGCDYEGKWEGEGGESSLERREKGSHLRKRRRRPYLRQGKGGLSGRDGEVKGIEILEEREGKAWEK